ELGSSVVLGSGKVLVAGGAPGVEIFTPLGLGVACVGDGECQSGFCTDGVCCDARCDGLCASCTMRRKGSGVDGQSGPNAEGTERQDEWPTSRDEGCGLTGSCDGRGACAFYPQGSRCGNSSCQGVDSIKTECDGRGACVQVARRCVPYSCANPEACRAD